MSREIKTLDEAIIYLINVSDVLETVRKKLSTQDMIDGQNALSKAVFYFQKAKKELSKDDANRGEE